MRKLIVIFICAALFSGLTTREEPSKKADNFTLDDYNGAHHSLSDFKNSRAIVIMFIATRCPVSNSYNGRMNDLYRDYTDRNIAFVAINSNKEEDVEEIKSHALEKGFKFPVLKDRNNLVADKFGATVTPEIYVLNPGLDILYHGRIDNSSRLERVTSNDLRTVLDEILNSKPIAVASTKAFGCTIKKVD